jgi:hypothetical protein
MPIKICLFCKKEFYVAPSIEKLRTCCSKQCRTDFNASKRKNLVCKHCGKHFTRCARYILSGPGHGTYCSITCNNAAKAKHPENDTITCNICKQVKPLTDFYACGKYKDDSPKYGHRCKSCSIERLHKYQTELPVIARFNRNQKGPVKEINHGNCH